MTISFGTRAQRVTGGRLASSAQPPRATLFPTHRPSSPPAPQPFPPASFLDTSGALLEGLRCFTAFRPLPFHFLKETSKRSGSD